MSKVDEYIQTLTGIRKQNNDKWMQLLKTGLDCPRCSDIMVSILGEIQKHDEQITRETNRFISGRKETDME